ncbi:hypothetical protein SSBG_00570 [Streptomyces sp. SPB074]|nr:hypothetical protein SSBG_00570 [Streptomyces sp. SPB074]
MERIRTEVAKRDISCGVAEAETTACDRGNTLWRMTFRQEG